MKLFILSMTLMLVSSIVFADYIIVKDGDKIKVNDRREYSNGNAFSIEKTVLPNLEIEKLNNQKIILTAARDAKLSDIENSMTYILRMQAEADAMSSLIASLDTQINSINKKLSEVPVVDPIIEPTPVTDPILTTEPTPKVEP